MFENASYNTHKKHDPPTCAHSFFAALLRVVSTQEQAARRMNNFLLSRRMHTRRKLCLVYTMNGTTS